jgi:transcriptional regulator with XRE-family HTH domain
MLRAFHSSRYQNMCRRLKEARRRSGLTQAQAARALGQALPFAASGRARYQAEEPGAPLSSILMGDPNGPYALRSSSAFYRLVFN